MSLILGLDPSQSTGWALYDTAADLSAIRCGVLKAKSGEGKFEENAGLLGHGLMKLIKEIGRPDFAAVERAPRQSAGSFGGRKGRPATVRFMGQDVEAQDGDAAEGGGGLQSTLSTNQMAAALCAILGAYQIPYETLTPAEWRKPAYGFGTRKGWQRKDWKRHAREKCAQVKIVVTNDDMAEAVWVAFAAKACDTFRWIEAQAAEKKARAAA